MQPQEIDFLDTAPIQVEGSAVVDGTPAEVWAVLLDYEGWPRWFPGVATCRATSDPATGLGSTRRVTLPGGARFDERFIAWDEERRWTFTGIDARPGLVRALVEQASIAPLGPGRTRVTYQMAFAPAPLVRPLAPILRRALPGRLRSGMEGLGREVVSRRA